MSPRVQQPNNNDVQADLVPTIPNPVPVPATPNDVQADPTRAMSALEVMDSEDELVSDMVLTPRQEQRLRRQLQLGRDRASSDSSDQ